MEPLEGVKPMPLRPLSIGNGITFAIGVLGIIAAVHDYMEQSRLIEQGWTVCSDHNGLALCPPHPAI